ncbi:syndecan-2-B-like [Brachyistius frenatus]|uniref:syndecan-2-B-like n=1 Tax=Brachyistius frenatus TaxID=100188 RepID=UPI0037E7F8DC
MWLSVTASLILVLGLMSASSTSLSAPLVDLEGSGYDLDSSGSGSGDGSEQVSSGVIKDQANRKDGHIFAADGSSGLIFDGTHEPAGDTGSEFVILANNKSFLEHKELLAAVIAGGGTGVVIAATLAAILIYKWQKKDEDGYIPGQLKDSDEGHHNTEEVV